MNELFYAVKVAGKDPLQGRNNKGPTGPLFMIYKENYSLLFAEINLLKNVGSRRWLNYQTRFERSLQYFDKSASIIVCQVRHPTDQMN